MIRQRIIKLIEKAIKELQVKKKLPQFDILEIIIEHPEEKNYGDYSTSIAMKIGKEIKKDPMKTAENLKSQISNLKIDLFEKIEAVSPGFINFYLSEKGLLNFLEKVLKEKERYGSSKIGKGKTMVIDYSSPNIAKPFGVGHLRSTIIGQALYNIYKFLGWKCVGDNHIGDWGSQFGKLIVAIKKWNKKELKNLTIQELENLYVKFHQEAEKDPGLLEEGREEFKKLEQRDRENKKIWQFCVNLNLKELDRIYNILGIKIDYALGESFYQDKMEEVIKDAEKKGIAKKSEGALVISLSDIKTPLMLLKSDGATTYATRDLATIRYRIKRWRPDLIIWEVGADQKLYFQQLFEAAQMLGYGKKEQLFTPLNSRKANLTGFIHIAHGLVRSSTGKFSTRKGETIHLEEILKEVIEKAKNIVSQSETLKKVSEKEKQKIAEKIGIGAVKYNDLSRHHSRDIVFDWDKALSLEGNSAPYLQYTFIRCQSVLKKANWKNNYQKIKFIEFNSEEKNLLREIYKFGEIVEQSAKNFSPNLICNYIFYIAQRYNYFYELYPIISATNQELKSFRLALTAAVAQILKTSLSLLGISVPQKM
jgi:arginyl-tRNA synthetase